jgi:hypothetical protein
MYTAIFSKLTTISRNNLSSIYQSASRKTKANHVANRKIKRALNAHEQQEKRSGGSEAGKEVLCSAT